MPDKGLALLYGRCKAHPVKRTGYAEPAKKLDALEKFKVVFDAIRQLYPVRDNSLCTTLI